MRLGGLTRRRPGVQVVAWNCVYHVLLAHAAAVKRFRDIVPGGSISMNLNCDWAEPLTSSAADQVTYQRRAGPRARPHALFARLRRPAAHLARAHAMRKWGNCGAAGGVVDPALAGDVRIARLPMLLHLLP